jgi:hypothetical protein
MLISAEDMRELIESGILHDIHEVGRQVREE